MDIKNISFFCILFLLIFINEMSNLILNNELRSARLRSYIYMYLQRDILSQ